VSRSEAQACSSPERAASDVRTGPEELGRLRSPRRPGARRRWQSLERFDLEAEDVHEAVGGEGVLEHVERSPVAVQLRPGLRGVEPGVDEASQLSDLGDLVRGVHGEREAAGAADPFPHVVLAALLVVDLRVVADERDQVGDLRPELRVEVGALGVGVLQDVVEDRRGDDVVRVARALEQRGDSIG
jgi:hypothetical protein